MTMLTIRASAAACAGAAAALWLTPAYPHAVCGARIFPATLAIDDPGVLDELTLPAVSYVPFNSDAAHEWDASFAWTKTITPGLSVVIGDGPTWEHPGGYGWNGLDTELQWQALCIPDAEFMFKVGFDISWAGTGTGALAGSGGENTYSPLVVAGLGFGTLPESVKYLRPFAITAEFGTSSRRARIGRTAIPTSPRSTGGSPSNTACRTSTRSWLRSTTTSSSISSQSPSSLFRRRSTMGRSPG